jgi:RimJ/RimL family protein N-acetyltransferase
MVEYIKEVLESERLKYIPIEMTEKYDFEEIDNYMQSKEMEEISEKMIITKRTNSKEESKEFLNKEIERAKNNEKMSYILKHKEDNEFVGIGTMFVTEDKVGFIGIWLKKKYWGRGLSKERANKFLDILFNKINVAKVRVVCFKNNYKAKKAIEKYTSDKPSKYLGIEYNSDFSEYVHVFEIYGNQNL